MKNACFALIGFLATAAFADLKPNTIIDNVPGDTTLSNLVAASGVLNPPWGSGGGGVDTNAVEVIANEAVKTNAVTVGLLSSVSNRYTKDETDALLSGKQADIGIVKDAYTVVMPEDRSLAVQGALYVTGSANISGSLNAAYITVDNKEVALRADIPEPYTPPPYLRAYDEVRKCWWRGRMVNGVINWEVE